MGKGLPRSMSRGAAQRQEIIKQTIVVDAVALSTITGATGVAQDATAVIGDFPEGNILLLGAVGYFQVAGSGSDANLTADWQGDFSVGSAPTADVTLNGAEVDILPSTELAAATAEVSPRTRSVNATQVMLDNTDGSLEINFNFVIDADEVTNTEDVALTVTGELHLAYIVLGDD